MIASSDPIDWALEWHGKSWRKAWLVTPNTGSIPADQIAQAFIPLNQEEL